jgi:UDP-3-O-[3-hydroxymyristoyl] glucosamine N-acyltransferase
MEKIVQSKSSSEPLVTHSTTVSHPGHTGHASLNPVDAGAPWSTLGELAALLGGTLEGPADFPLDGVTTADTGNARGIGFAESEVYVTQAKASGVGSLLLPPGLDAQGIPAIRVAVPRQAFFLLLHRAYRPWPIAGGIHPTAVVDPLAVIDPSANIGAYVVVERYAQVAAGAKVFPFAYIGEACSVGEGSQIGPHAVLMQSVLVGARTTIQPGAILGADGFGYVFDGQRHVKIPQVGKVVIGDHVEIGALTAIDRAVAGETTIDDGTKLDNLIQVGHNTHIGKHTVIAALTGISGTTTIGSNVVMGGQCATVDHVSITDGVSMAGRTAAIHSITEPGEYFGAPAKPVKEGMRNMLLSSKLGDLFARLRKVEKRVQELDNSSAGEGE